MPQLVPLSATQASKRNQQQTKNKLFMSPKNISPDERSKPSNGSMKERRVRILTTFIHPCHQGIQKTETPTTLLSHKNLIKIHKISYLPKTYSDTVQTTVTSEFPFFLLSHPTRNVPINMTIHDLKTTASKTIRSVILKLKVFDI